MRPFVSIIVPTRDRVFFTENILRNFYRQNYDTKNMELIILDDSLEPRMKELLPNNKNIRYYHLKRKSPMPIGRKRNKLSELAAGEIIVQMDDDDFYPAGCVNYAVNKLKPKKYQVACLNNLYVFYLKNFKIAHLRIKDPSHIVAFKKSYLKKNKFNDKDKVTEEVFFLKGNKNKIVPLEGRRSMLMVAHSKNTSEKNLLLDPVTVTSLTIEDFMGEETDINFYTQKLFNKYKPYISPCQAETYLDDPLGNNIPTFNFMAACGAARRRDNNL